jgi:MoaA/NifB/PqqE/SkfB family radical SAM enzyme
MKPGVEMSAAQVAVAFSKLDRLDVIRLTGGEPFLRDDFSAIARIVHEKSRPLVIHVTTNGSFPSKIANFVTEFPAPEKLRFMVSFDGLEEEHNASRGTEVLFATAFESVEILVRMRDRFGINVSINHTVISRRSLHDHAELVRRFQPLGVDVHAVLAYSDSAMYGAKRFGKKANDLIPEVGYPLHPDLAGADTVGFVRRQLRELHSFRDPVLRLGKRYYLRGLLARLKNNPVARPRPQCVALRSHIRVLPDGSVPVCQFNTERVGNLLTQSLDEIWNGDATVRSREWVDSCVGCWAECEVMPSAIYSGDLFRSLL